jgi:hypothetical protein
MTKVKLNYRKNKKSVLLSLLLIVCLLFGMNAVYSVDPPGTSGNQMPGPGRSPVPPNGGGGDAGCDRYVCPGSNKNRVIWGVRMALVDKAGNKVSGTDVIDVWPDWWVDDVGGDALLIGYSNPLNDKKLKNEVIAGGAKNYTVFGKTEDIMAQWKNNNNPKGNGTHIWIMSAWASGGIRGRLGETWSLLPTYIYESMKNSYTSVDIGSSISNAMQSYIDAMNNPEIFPAPKRLKELVNMFKWFGMSVTEKEISEGTIDLGEYYIHFEPLILYTVPYPPYPGSGNYLDVSKYHRIYGTITEFASLSGYFPGYFLPSNSYPGYLLYYLGIGIQIAPGKERPSNYRDKTLPAMPFSRNDDNTGQPRLNRVNQLITNDNGWNTLAVAHIWLRELFTKGDTCEDMLKHITDNYTGIQLDAMADKLRTEGFEYTDDGGGIHSIGPQNFSLLNPTIYKDSTKNQYGDSKPHCDNGISTPAACPYNKSVAVCTNASNDGISYFKDNSTTACWLEKKIAFTADDGQNYSSDNTGHEAVETTNGGIVGNQKYCELFCYEEITTKFPLAVSDVKAGQTFLWGEADGTFGKIQFKKKCSNQTYIKGKQGYRFEEWEKDYKDNEQKMIDNWLEYQLNTWGNKKENMNVTSRRVTSCSDTCCGTKRYRTNQRTGAVSCTCVSGTRWTAIRKSNTSKTNSTSDGNWIRSTESVDAKTGSACTENDAVTAAQVSTSTYYTNWGSAVREEPNLLEQIRQCTNNIKYVHETIVTFVFQEPINSAYGANSRNFTANIEMLIDPDRADGYNKDNIVMDGDRPKTCKWKTVYRYTCGGSGTSANCNATPEKVLDCVQVTWEIDGEYTYSYPIEEFQWFSDKRDSTLVNQKNKPSGDEAYFYSIGFGLPTAFSLTDGNYEMKVIVSNLGDNGNTKAAQQSNLNNIIQYNTEYGHFYPIAESVVDTNLASGTGYGFEYKCIYEVTNEIFGYDCNYNGKNLVGESPVYCDNTKDDKSNGKLEIVDIAYRVVQLLKPSDSINVAFPGIDGAGRRQGSNWAKLSYDETYDVLNANVYESLAMYEIMLDVNGIQYIRESNKKYFDQGMDPYTSYVNHNNAPKVYCKSKGANGEFKYCASQFLTDLQTFSRHGYNLMGTCLPSGMGTETRAQDVLDNGCHTTYVYTPISWVR